MYFDGNNDYVTLTPWSWGGATTVEVYVRFSALNPWSRIFEFTSASATFADPVVLAVSSIVSASTNAQGYGKLGATLTHARTRSTLSPSPQCRVIFP